jgi:hypothetical protein
MKTLLTLLLSLSSLLACAQKFMIGAHGGVLFNTPPTGSSEYFTNFESTPQMIVGGKLGIDTRKIQLGLGCYVSSISYTREQKLQNANSPFSYAFSAPIVNPYLFVNFKKNLVRSFLYFGANAGVTSFTNAKDDGFYQGQEFDREFISKNSITLGLQAGARIKLAEGLGIAGEAGMRYTMGAPGMMTHDQLGNPMGMYEGGGIFSFPLTLGIDYIF